MHFPRRPKSRRSRRTGPTVAFPAALLPPFRKHGGISLPHPDICDASRKELGIEDSAVHVILILLQNGAQAPSEEGKPLGDRLSQPFRHGHACYHPGRPHFQSSHAVLGGFASLSALAMTQFPEVKVGDDPVAQTRITSDHVLLQGQLASGAPLGIEISGGRPSDADTTFEVTGTQGTLTLRGGAMRGVQSGRFHLLLNGEPPSIDEGEMSSMSDAATNVAGIYAMLRNDIQ